MNPIGSWLAISLLLATPTYAQIASEYGARGSPLSLEQDLQDAIVAFLVQDPGDAIGIETAKLLKDGSVPIRLDHIPEASIGAIYDQTEKAVLINLDYIATRYASGAIEASSRELVINGIRASWERNPTALQRFVSDMAPLLIHELRHAAFAQKLGPHPSSIEEEMACHAYEALFVRRRLRKDPEYLEFRTYDGLVRQYLGEPPASGTPWWREPFPFSPIHEIADTVAKVNEKFPGRFKVNPLLWLHVRSLSEGFAHYRLVFVSTYPQEKFSLETEPKEILAELREIDPDAHDGSPPPPESRIHRIATKFWSEPERVRTALETFDNEWPRLEGMIKAEDSPAETAR